MLWEAQFGDFVNGAQVIIDQFLACAETKWGQPSGLVLLLPHGYEGQGPEHSSARIERFLQLSAEDNLRVAYPSTPAQYFHLLRRQGRDPVEKPLVVFTPKSLLRHPRCVSSLAELAEGRFEPVIDDRAADAGARRARGALQRQDLLRPAEGAARTVKRDDAALVRVEQLYPFPAARARRRRSHGTRRRPSSCGARRSRGTWARGASCASASWTATSGRPGRVPLYAGRAASAAPAPGSLKVHLAEQDALVREALGA